MWKSLMWTEYLDFIARGGKPYQDDQYDHTLKSARERRRGNTSRKESFETAAAAVSFPFCREREREDG